MSPGHRVAVTTSGSRQVLQYSILSQWTLAMSRPLRLELSGALYFVTSRGDRREDTYHDDTDRETWLETLAQGCKRYHPAIHAFAPGMAEHRVVAGSIRHAANPPGRTRYRIPAGGRSRPGCLRQANRSGLSGLRGIRRIDAPRSRPWPSTPTGKSQGSSVAPWRNRGTSTATNSTGPNQAFCPRLRMGITPCRRSPMPWVSITPP